MTSIRFEAVILAGGKSSRLDGWPKARLRLKGITLVERSVRAAAAAEAVVVVGPADLPVPAGVLRTRETPAFGGPAAALAAGLVALGNARDESDRAPWTMVLACDMPEVGRAVQTLVSEVTDDAEGNAYLGVSEDGHQEPLAALYRTAALVAAFDGEDATDRSVFSFIRRLGIHEVRMPADATSDVDTWDAVSRFALDASSPIDASSH